jgi:AcrR family transcriptional regulator
MTTPNAARTARERARAELTREIKEAARRQLAAVGADGLSLRAVSRELGMVSSALYRYYPSRDDLLTSLIIDAYTALGEAAEGAIAGVRPGAGAGAGRARWVAACGAIRAWAVANPHEYALIYGSPVPGYRAPDATIGPAARVPFALAGVLADAVAAGEMSADPGPVADPERTDLKGPDLERTGLGSPLAAQAAALSAALVRDATADAAVRLAAAVPADVLVRAVIAWAQLFGMISFELFGQFVGSFEPADALFAYGVAQLASFVGLR